MCASFLPELTFNFSLTSLFHSTFTVILKVALFPQEIFELQMSSFFLVPLVSQVPISNLYNFPFKISNKRTHCVVKLNVWSGATCLGNISLFLLTLEAASLSAGNLSYSQVNGSQTLI